MVFRFGKVHKKAFAKRQATCCWLIETVRFSFFLSRGIAVDINSGHCRASFIIFGNKLLKKCSDSSSSNSFSNISCNVSNFHELAYFELYDKIAASNSLEFFIGLLSASWIIVHLGSIAVVPSSFSTGY